MVHRLQEARITHFDDYVYHTIYHFHHNFYKHFIMGLLGELLFYPDCMCSLMDGFLMPVWQPVQLLLA